MKSSILYRIIGLRRHLKLSRAQVAEALGMKRIDYSKLEEEGPITVEMVVRIAQLFNVSFQYLCFGDVAPDYIQKHKANKGIPKPYEFEKKKGTPLFVSEPIKEMELFEEPKEFVPPEHFVDLEMWEQDLVLRFRRLNDEELAKTFDFVNQIIVKQNEEEGIE